MKTRIGDQPLKLRGQQFGDVKNYNPLNREYSDSTVSSFVDLIVSGKAGSYAGNIPMEGDSESVFGVTMPQAVPRESLRRPSIWLGPQGCVTPLHRDSADNFAMHLFGSKRWTLFPPEQTEHLGMMSMAGLPATGGEFAISQINIEDPDVERFPEFENARPIVVDIQADEVLFLPAGWHHHVRTLETSLMLNYWVQDASISPAFLKPLQ